MKYKLFRKLEDGEKIEEGDVRGMDGDPCGNDIGEVFHDEDFWTILRPVSTETATGSTQESEAERLKLLREHYAGLAMQALLPFFRDKSNMFEIAVASADALIAALNKKEEGV